MHLLVSFLFDVLPHFFSRLVLFQSLNFDDGVQTFFLFCRELIRFSDFRHNFQLLLAESDHTGFIETVD